MHILFCSITATNLGQFSKPGTELKSAGPDFFKAPPYTSNLTNFMLRYLGLETHDRGRFHHDIPILITDWSPKDISLEVKTLVSLQLLITQGCRHPGICLYHSFVFMLIYLTEGKTIEIWTICVKSNWLDMVFRWYLQSWNLLSQNFNGIYQAFILDVWNAFMQLYSQITVYRVNFISKVLSYLNYFVTFQRNQKRLEKRSQQRVQELHQTLQWKKSTHIKAAQLLIIPWCLPYVK